jgi:hypothetical protein
MAVGVSNAGFRNSRLGRALHWLFHLRVRLVPCATSRGSTRSRRWQRSKRFRLLDFRRAATTYTSEHSPKSEHHADTAKAIHVANFPKKSIEVVADRQTVLHGGHLPEFALVDRFRNETHRSVREHELVTAGVEAIETVHG